MLTLSRAPQQQPTGIKQAEPLWCGKNGSWDEMETRYILSLLGWKHQDTPANSQGQPCTILLKLWLLRAANSCVLSASQGGLPKRSATYVVSAATGKCAAQQHSCLQPCTLLASLLLVHMYTTTFQRLATRQQTQQPAHLSFPCACPHVQHDIRADVFVRPPRPIAQAQRSL